MDPRSVLHSLPIVRIRSKDLRVDAARDRPPRRERHVQRIGVVQTGLYELRELRKEREVVVSLNQPRCDRIGVLEENRSREIRDRVRERLIGSHRSVLRRLQKQRVAQLAVMPSQRHAVDLLLHGRKRTQRKRGKMLLPRDERQRGQIPRVNQRRAEVQRGESHRNGRHGERGNRGNEEGPVRAEFEKLRFRGTVEIGRDAAVFFWICVPICVPDHNESKHRRIQVGHEIAENGVFPAGHDALIGQISVIRAVSELHQLRIPREFPERHAENLEIQPFGRSLHLFLTNPRETVLYSRL